MVGLLMPVGAGAQNEPAESLEDLVIHDSVDLGLRQIYATVTDLRGRRVPDLDKSAFQLKDDGESREVITLGAGELPFTAVVLVDSSLSMEGPALDAAWDGLRSFLGGMRPLDEARVLLFADVLQWSSPFSQDPAALEAEPRSFGELGGTSVLDHLYLGVRQLETRHGRPVVILLSDGVDVHSVLEADQVESAFHRSPAALYWVRLHGDGSEPTRDRAPQPSEERWEFLQRSRNRLWLTSFRPARDTSLIQRTLTRIVEESGGRTLDVVHRREIAPALEEILRELREQYALGYYPEVATDKAWRELSIQVPGRGFKVRYRRGYFP